MDKKSTMQWPEDSYQENVLRKNMKNINDKQKIEFKWIYKFSLFKQKKKNETNESLEFVATFFLLILCTA